MKDFFQTKNDLANKKEIALKEYFHVSERIDKYDERCLKIKSWSVTLSSVIIGLSITQKAPGLFLLSASSALVFWIIETLWKYYQRVLIWHNERIEDFLTGKIDVYAGPGMNAAFRDALTWEKEKQKLPELFWYRNVILPHMFIVIFAIIGYFISTFGV